MNAQLLARDIMVTKLITLKPEMDVFQAIDLLLRNRISGAPVIDDNRMYLGVFSERCCMRVLTDAAYDGLPTTEITPYIDREARTIDEETDLLAIAQLFQDLNARRLPVLRDGELVGQISRRDVLEATHSQMRIAENPTKGLLYLSSLVDRRDAPIS